MVNKSRVFLACIIMVLCLPLRAQVWQWSKQVDSISLPSGDHPIAFLWIPPNCAHVRAVVFANNNMLEEGILEDHHFRNEMSRLCIAELLVTPLFAYWQNAGTNDATNRKFNELLRALAEESGYVDLVFAPIIPLGHSASATMPWNFAAWNPKRTVAVLSIHGDAPQTHLTGNSRPNAPWGERNVNGIPGLMVMAEYEWWEDRLTPVFTFKKKYPAAPIAFLCDAGNGHFNSSPELISFITMFIRKAVELRVDRSDHLNASPQLKAINPENGWLVDRWRQDAPSVVAPAPYRKYKGDRAESFWAFDREMARATERYYARSRGKRPQLLGIIQDGMVVPTDPKQSDEIHVKVPPLDDSLQFRLRAVFLDTVPKGLPEKWTGMKGGQHIDHASGGGPVKLSRITGPFVQLSANTFAIRFNRLSIPGDRKKSGICIIAKHPGDSRYKGIVLPVLMNIPARLTVGSRQVITFNPIADQIVGARSLALNAVSSAQAPVHYYVRQGPAEITGDRLTFTKIPPRTHFPVKVTVVAWQYGRTTEPKLQSAQPVERTFSIVRKHLGSSWYH